MDTDKTRFKTWFLTDLCKRSIDEDSYNQGSICKISSLEDDRPAHPMSDGIDSLLLNAKSQKQEVGTSNQG
jgi:hypothetical protein